MKVDVDGKQLENERIDSIVVSDDLELEFDYQDGILYFSYALQTIESPDDLSNLVKALLLAESLWWKELSVVGDKDD